MLAPLAYGRINTALYDCTRIANTLKYMMQIFFVPLKNLFLMYTFISDIIYPDLVPVLAGYGKRLSRMYLGTSKCGIKSN